MEKVLSDVEENGKKQEATENGVNNTSNVVHLVDRSLMLEGSPFRSLLQLHIARAKAVASGLATVSSRPTTHW